MASVCQSPLSHQETHLLSRMTKQTTAFETILCVDVTFSHHAINPFAHRFMQRNEECVTVNIISPEIFCISEEDSNSAELPRLLLLQPSNARLQQQHPPLCELSALPLSEVYEHGSHCHAQGESNLLYPCKMIQIIIRCIFLSVSMVKKPPCDLHNK